MKFKKRSNSESLPSELNNSGKSMSPAIRRNDSMGQVRALEAFISQSPNIFGGTDIYNLSVRNALTLVGNLAGVLIGLVDSEGKQVVQKFVIIIPPALNTESCGENVWNGISTSFRLLAQREMQPPEKEWIKRRLQLISAPDQRINSLIDIIRAQPEFTSILIPEATLYRDDSIEPYITAGASSPLQPEDIWVPQLHALATEATKLTQENKIYVALNANQLSPSRQNLSDLLISVEGCGVMGSSAEQSPESILATHVDQWEMWIQEGRFGQALLDIDQLPEQLDSNKPYLRIQILHKAGHSLEALKATRELIAHNPELNSETRVKLAKITQEANASKLSLELLSPVITQLHTQEELESALATAQDAGLTDLENEIVERIEVLFPDSPGLRKRLLRSLLDNRDYVGAADLAAKDSADEANFYRTLALFLSENCIPDYIGLIAYAGSDTPQAEAYRMACVKDALSRKLIPQAFELAIPLPNTPTQAEHGEKLLLQVLKNILLINSSEGALDVRGEAFQTAFMALIERLGAKPEDQGFRVNLARLIQPSVAGSMGLAQIVSTMLNLASRPIRLEKKRYKGKKTIEWLLEHKPFLSKAFEWLGEQGAVVIGRSVLPKSLLTESPDDVVSALADSLDKAPIESDEDIKSHLDLLGLATSVTPYCSDADYDLVLMRLVASKFASFGREQLARDIVEQILLNSAATSRRRRLGWFAMADVYHHCHNQLEAFLAMACSLAANDAGDEEQIWYEITVMTRLLRDSGLYNEARKMIQTGKQILQRMNLGDAYSHRLDTLDLQIRQKNLQIGGEEIAELEILLADVVQNGSSVLNQQDVTAPVAVMLGQLLQRARQVGATIPAEANDVFAELTEHTRGNHLSLVKLISEGSITAETLFAALKTGDSARYSDDVGYDIHNEVIAAKLALNDDDFISDAISTSLALEILADRGVGIPGWDEASTPPPNLKNIDEPSEIARSISNKGISVVQAGFNSSGRFVSISTVNGISGPPVKEPDDLILEERFRIWSEKYPYAYGLCDELGNIFYTTTEDLCLSSLPEGPVVIVADASFQLFPPNIIYVHDNFAGRKQAMAMAPSLSWLQVACSKGMIGDGRLCSWISTAVGVSERQTLSMISERLEPTFNQYDFIVDNGPTLPDSFAGASIAIIAAHGGVHPEGRYFQVVSDEGILRVTASGLANALRNVGIVILFVCSGGRADKHPGAHTTLGLAKEILDRGCTAVIASTWPLDARVPSHWLPTFLEHWFQGETLIEANYCANKVVDRNFSHNPAYGLAMTIFGNPLLRMI